MFSRHCNGPPDNFFLAIQSMLAYMFPSPSREVYFDEKSRYSKNSVLLY